MFLDRGHIRATHDEHQVTFPDIQFTISICPGETAAVDQGPGFDEVRLGF